MLYIFIFIIVMKGTEGYLNVIYIYIRDEGYLNNFCSLVQRLFDKVSLLI